MRMQFGVTMWAADFAMSVLEVGRAVEEHGLESLFLPEHTHIPVKRSTAWAGGPSADPPPEYAHGMDPFVGLAAVAAVTTRLKIGTGICLVIQREPITLAKEVASVDHLSGGRFLFGVGVGWLREEIENHGIAFRDRWDVFGERMRVMQTIWQNDEATFEGQYHRFQPIWSWPKPVQKPRPPVLMGGDFQKAMERVIEYADEWMPHPDRGEEPLAQRVAKFHEMCEQAGRGKLPITIFGAPPERAALEEYAAAGVTRCVFRLPAAGRDRVMPALEETARLAESFNR
jgi:probable F420-dependent oxidoreductase